MLQRRLIVLFALCCGVTGANVLLLQPIVIPLAQHFHVSAYDAGNLASWMQEFFAVGIALLGPLADSIGLKKLLSVLGTASVLCLAGMTVTSSWTVFSVCACVLCVCCPIPQILIPVAVAKNRNPDNSSALVGTLQAGLLGGILLARLYSGVVAYYCSVPMVFAIATVLNALACALVLREVWNKPEFKVGVTGGTSVIPGVALLRAIPYVFRKPYALGMVCFSGVLVGITFGAFWNTLSYTATAWFHLSSATIGAFGLVAGISGVVSPIAGKLARRYGLVKIQGLCVAGMIVGWVCLLWGSTSIGLVIVATVIIDSGLWANQVLNQAAAFEISQLGRGITNTIYFAARFTSIAVGSLYGIYMFRSDQWNLLVIGNIGILLVSWLLYAIAVRLPHRQDHHAQSATIA